MAARFWVAGSGNWNDTAHWSATSGGTAGASVPTTGDTATVDFSSGSPTISMNGVSPSLNALTLIPTGFPPSLGNMTLNFTNGEVFTIAGNLTIGRGVTINHNSTSGFTISATGTIENISQSYSGQQAPLGVLTIAPGAANSVSFSNGEAGASGSWFNAVYNIAVLNHTNGTIVLPAAGGQAPPPDSPAIFNIGSYNSNNSNVRGIDFSVKTIYGQYQVINISTLWDVGAGTNYTITHGGSNASNTFVLAQGVTFNGGGLNWPGANLDVVSTIYSQDSFTDASGTDLINHVPNSGGAWVRNGATATTTFLIDGSNRIYAGNGGTVECICLLNQQPPSNDYIVSLDAISLSNPSGSEIGVVGRWASNNLNGYLLQFSNNNINLYKNVNGAWTQLGSNYPYTPQTGVPFTLQLVMTGSQILGVLNGGTVISVNDSTFWQAGYAGVRASEASGLTTGTHGDNFKIIQFQGTQGTYVANVHSQAGNSGLATTINGNNTFDFIEPYGGAAGLIIFTGNATIGTLQAAPGLAYAFQGNTSLTTVSNLIGAGITLNPAKTHSWGLGTSLSGAINQNFGLQSSVAGTQVNLTITSPATAAVAYWTVKDINMSGSVITIYRGTNQGDNSATFVFLGGIKKYFIYDVYTPGGTYIGHYPDVINEPNNSQEVNNPGGEVVIRRAADPTNFGEGALVTYNNQVVIRAFDEHNPNGIVWFTGFISQYTPNMEGNANYVDITLLPYAAEFSQFYAVTDPVLDQQTNFTNSGQDAVSAYVNKVAFRWKTGSGVTNMSQLNFMMGWTGTGAQIDIYADTGGNPDAGTHLLSMQINTVLYYQQWNYQTQSYTGAYNFYYGQFQQQILPILSLTASTDYWVVVTPTGLDPYGATSQISVPETTTANTDGSLRLFVANWGAAVTGQYAMFQTFGSAGNTTVPYTGTLLAAIQNVIKNYQTLGGHVTYTNTSLDPALANVTINYTFQTNTVLECIDKFLDFAPAGYYWYVDQATSILYFQKMAATPKHYFTMGRDVYKCQLQKTMETIINDFLITGGPTAGVNLFRRYLNLSSIARYGRRQQNYNDSQLTNTTTADLIGNKYVSQYKNPTQRAPIEVLAYPDTGYPIETIRPGDTFFVQGLPASVMLQISRVDYMGVTARLDSADVPPQLTSIVNEIEGSIAQTATSANPSSPTNVNVP